MEALNARGAAGDFKALFRRKGLGRGGTRPSRRICKRPKKIWTLGDGFGVGSIVLSADRTPNSYALGLQKAKNPGFNPGFLHEIKQGTIRLFSELAGNRRRRPTPSQQPLRRAKAPARLKPKYCQSPNSDCRLLHLNPNQREI